jgi:hypothetical protein
MSEYSPGKRLFGGILVGVGILLAGASGACSVWFLVQGAGADNGFWQIVLLVGGIPFAFGALFMLVGCLLLKAGKGTPPDGGTRF